jgi:hypothetical protein
MKAFTLLLLILITASIFGQTQEPVIKVKYLSAESVYIDGGTAQGLAVGDKLIVRNGHGVIADLEVVYVSENSASCKVIKQNSEIVPGNMVVVFEKAPREEQPVQEEQQPEVKPEPQYPRKTYRSSTRGLATKISGSVSAQVYYYDDKSASNLDFTQPTMRLNFRAQNLWGRNFHLRIRTRARYNQRTRSYNSIVPKDEWRNRIYEFSFSYENENAPVNFKTGRIISNHISGVGYIDGLLLQHNISTSLRWGIFGGTQPQWQYSDFQTDFKKYGGYINYRGGDYRGFRFESTIAGAGVYHSGTISREFIYIQNTLSNSSLWNIYQSSELDVNRGWRKDKTGQDISLSNIFISARYKFSRAVAVGLSYDNRKNYWTYETRTLTDSLFDDLLRRGVRGNMTLRLPYNFTITTDGGYRKRDGDPDPTYSYGGGINKTNIVIERLFIHLRGSGFSNPYSDGYSFTAQMGKYFLTGNYLSVGYGNYFYNFSSTNLKRTNQWARLEGEIQLIKRFYLSSQYEYDFGEDVDGHRVFAEIGYRF